MSDAVIGDNNSAGAVTLGGVESVSETQSDAIVDAPNSGDMFPRSYVEELRKESAGYRDRAKHADERADDLAQRLHRALVAATGRLENAADLRFDAENLDNTTRLAAALDALLTDRPYLAKRVVAGDAGQGARGDKAATPTFADMFRT